MKSEGLEAIFREHFAWNKARFVAHVMDLYGRRWAIETLFGCLKSTGLHFEFTRIVKPARLTNLTALLSITFACVHRIAEWRHAEKLNRVKNMAGSR